MILAFTTSSLLNFGSVFLILFLSSTPFLCYLSSKCPQALICILFHIHPTLLTQGKAKFVFPKQIKSPKEDQANQIIMSINHFQITVVGCISFSSPSRLVYTLELVEKSLILLYLGIFPGNSDSFRKNQHAPRNEDLQHKCTHLHGLLDAFLLPSCQTFASHSISLTISLSWCTIVAEQEEVTRDILLQRHSDMSYPNNNSS